MNQKEFAQMTGIATSTLSNIFNGRTLATLNHVQALHETFPELSLEWMLTGKGEMYGAGAMTAQRVVAPTLFGDEGGGATASVVREESENVAPAISGEEILDAVKEVAAQMEKPQRNVVEIRVFYDDGKFDVFYANSNVR